MAGVTAWWRESRPPPANDFSLREVGTWSGGGTNALVAGVLTPATTSFLPPRLQFLPQGEAARATDVGRAHFPQGDLSPGGENYRRRYPPVVDHLTMTLDRHLAGTAAETTTTSGLHFTASEGEWLADRALVKQQLRSGRLIRLRRGAFVEADVWNAAPPRQKHILRIRAVVEMARNPVIVCGVSAAAVHGMPIMGEWLDEVSVLDRWKGGGRSEAGVRRWSAGFMTARIVTVDGLHVTDVARTALDIARRTSFEAAIGTLDWAIWRKNPGRITKLDLASELRLMNPRVGLRHLARLVEFSTSLSDSFGESYFRALFFLLGFEVPELQFEMRDHQGKMSSDYGWRLVRQVGEFDGKVKYSRNEYSQGDQADVLWREKKREDRIRALQFGVVRFIWNEIYDLPQLVAKLDKAGVPRRRS